MQNKAVNFDFMKDLFLSTDLQRNDEFKDLPELSFLDG